MSNDNRKNEKLIMDVQPKSLKIKEDSPGKIEIHNQLDPDNTIIVTDRESLKKEVDNAFQPIKGLVDGKLDKTEFDNVKTTFATNSDMTTELDKKLNKTKFTEYQNQVEQTYQKKQDISVLEDKVNQKLNTDQFDNFVNTELPRQYYTKQDVTEKLNKKLDLDRYNQEISTKANQTDLDSKVNNTDFDNYKVEQQKLIDKKATIEQLTEVKNSLTGDYLTKNEVINKLDLKVNKDQYQKDMNLKANKTELANLVNTSDYESFKQQIETEVNSKLTQTDKTELITNIDTRLPKTDFNNFKTTITQSLNSKLTQEDKTELDNKINTKIGQQEYQNIQDQLNVLKTGKKEFGSVNKSKAEIDSDLTLLTKYVQTVLNKPKAPMVDGYSVNTNDGYSYVYINGSWVFNGQDIIHNATLTTPGTVKLSNDDYKVGDGGEGTLKVNGLLELVNKVNRLETGRVTLDGNNHFTGLNKFTSNITLESHPTDDNHVARLYEIRSLENSITRKFTSYTPTSTLNNLLNNKVDVTLFNNLKNTVDSKANITDLDAFSTKEQLNTEKQRITTLETSKAEKSYVDTINTEVNNLKNEKVDKTEYGSLKSKVDKLSSSQVTSTEFNSFKDTVNQNLETKVSQSDYSRDMAAIQPEINKITTHDGKITQIETELGNVKEKSEINKQDLDGIKLKVSLLTGSVITLGSINKSKAEVLANLDLLTQRVKELGKTLTANIVLYTTDKAEFIYNGTKWEFLKQDGVVEATTAISGTIKLDGNDTPGSIIAGLDGTVKVSGFDNLKTNIESLDTKLTTVKSDLESTKQKLTTTKQTLDNLSSTLTTDYYSKNQINPLLNDKVNLTDFNNLQQTVSSKLDSSALTNYATKADLDSTKQEVNKLKTSKADASEFNTYKDKTTALERDKADKTSVTSLTSEVESLKTDRVTTSEFNTYKNDVQNKIDAKLDKTVENILNQKINTKVSQEAHDRLVSEVDLLRRGKRELGTLNKTRQEVTANKQLLTNYVKTILGENETPKEGYSINTSDGYSFIYVGSDWVDNGQDVINVATTVTPGTVKFKNKNFYLNASPDNDGTAVVQGLKEYTEAMDLFKQGIPTSSGNNTFTGNNTFSQLTISNAPTSGNHVVRKSELDNLNSSLTSTIDSKIGVNGNVTINGEKNFTNGVTIDSTIKLTKDNSGNLRVYPTATGKWVYFSSEQNNTWSGIDLKEQVILKGIKDPATDTEAVNKRTLDNSISNLNNSLNQKADSNNVVTLKGNDNQQIEGTISIYKNENPIKILYDAGGNSSVLSLGERSPSGGYTEKYKIGKKNPGSHSFHFEANENSAKWVFNRALTYSDSNIQVTEDNQLIHKGYLTQQLNEKTPQTDFNTLKGRVDSQESSITTINQNITTLTQETSTLKTKFDDYATKASLTDLETKVTNNTTKLGNVLVTNATSVQSVSNLVRFEGRITLKSTTSSRSPNYIDLFDNNTRTAYFGHASSGDRHFTIKAEVRDAKISLQNPTDITSHLNVSGNTVMSGTLEVRNHLKMGRGGGDLYISAEDDSDKTLHFANDRGRGRLQLDMSTRKIMNLGNATEPTDAVNLSLLSKATQDVFDYISYVNRNTLIPQQDHMVLSLYGETFHSSYNRPPGTCEGIRGFNLYRFRHGANNGVGDIDWSSEQSTWGTPKENSDFGNSFNGRVSPIPAQNALFSGDRVLRFDFNSIPASSGFTLSVRARHQKNPTDWKDFVLFVNNPGGSDWKSKPRLEWSGSTFLLYNYTGGEAGRYDNLNITDYHTYTISIRGENVKMYLDGSLVRSVTLSGGVGDLSSLWFYVSRGTGGSTTYNSQTETKSIRLWKTILTDAEVSTVYQEDLKL